MFEENDKWLPIADKINNVLVWVGICAGLLTGLILSCIEDGDYLAIGLPILFCVPIVSVLGWLAVRVVLGFFCDVKLIRNKLYGGGNGNLYAFLVRNSADDSFSSDSPKLMKLKKLLDQGIITQAEFNY